MLDVWRVVQTIQTEAGFHKSVNHAEDTALTEEDI